MPSPPDPSRARRSRPEVRSVPSPTRTGHGSPLPAGSPGTAGVPPARSGQDARAPRRTPPPLASIRVHSRLGLWRPRSVYRLPVRCTQTGLSAGIPSEQDRLKGGTPNTGAASWRQGRQAGSGGWRQSPGLSRKPGAGFSQRPGGGEAAGDCRGKGRSIRPAQPTLRRPGPRP